MLIFDMTVSMNGKITTSNDDELCNIYNINFLKSIVALRFCCNSGIFFKTNSFYVQSWEMYQTQRE